MHKAEALARLQKQLNTISEANNRGPSTEKWKRDTEIVIEKIFGADTRHLKEFRRINYRPGSYSLDRAQEAFQSAHRSGIANAKAILLSMVDEVQEFWTDSTPGTNDATTALARIEHLCKRFHLVAQQLRSRHADRDTLEIEDEYDVQDLLAGLLRIDFEDIRPEEWTPSYAGKSARLDFLLKDHSIVIEVKRTRKGLATKEIGEQLILDIARYKVHSDCKQLVCFVYDPEGRIGNPASLENDLKGTHNELDVTVIIAPRGL